MHHRANEITKQQGGENKGMLKNQGFLEQYVDLIIDLHPGILKI